jgi:hypothetical protein
MIKEEVVILWAIREYGPLDFSELFWSLFTKLPVDYPRIFAKLVLLAQPSQRTYIRELTRNTYWAQGELSTEKRKWIKDAVQRLGFISPAIE